MKNVLLVITLFFSTLVLAQKKSNQEVEKNRIIANVYAIVLDGKNDFENFKGDLISTNNNVTIYKAKNQNDATKNFFTATIKLDKAVYNMLKFESDDEKGEFFFRTVEQAFETLVTENRLTKKDLRFPAGSETKATTYYSVDGISPVAYIWYKSTDPVLRYSISICANKKVVDCVQNYVENNKINVPKSEKTVAKITSKSVLKIEEKPIQKEIIQTVKYGCISGNCENGYGIFKYNTGDTVEANFVNNLVEGKGTMIWSSGDKYIGEFKNDLITGIGKYTYLNGETYEGSIVNGIFQGKGKYVWNDGASYTGDWFRGKQDGKGTKVWSDGTIYSGNWTTGTLYGYGEMFWTDGGYYKGQFRNDKRDGRGKHVYSDGQINEGYFENGDFVQSTHHEKTNDEIINEINQRSEDAKRFNQTPIFGKERTFYYNSVGNKVFND